MRRGPAVLLLICLLFGAAYGAWRAASFGYKQLTAFEPAAARAERPVSGSAPLADRVVLLILDGLTADRVHRLPSLDWLRRRGADYRLDADGAAGAANLTAILLSGAPPARAGLLAGPEAGAERVDSLVEAAVRSQVPAGGAGGPALAAVAEGVLSPWHAGDCLADLEAAVHGMLEPGGPRLIIVQAADLAAEDADEAALAELDLRLVALFDLIDWRTTAVVVAGTGEDRGAGHGGPPLILAGSGVLAGGGGDATIYDVAPTVAALAGLPAPVSPRGKPILSALDIEGRPLDALTQVHLTSRRAWAAAALQGYGAADPLPPAPATAVEGAGYLERIEQQVSAARQNWLKEGARQRLPYVAPGLLLVLLYLLAVYRSRAGGAAFRAHLTYLAVFHALFFALGGTYGPAAAGAEGPWTLAALRYAPAAAAAALLAALTAGFAVSRREYRKARYVAAAGLHAALSGAALLALPVGAAVLLVGWEFPVALPPAGLWVWFFMTALQVMVIGALAPAWAIVTVQAARFARHRWPPPEVGDPEVNADRVVRLKALRRARKRS